MHAPRFSSAARSVVLALVVGFVTLVVPAFAAAAPKGDQATVDKVTNLNKKALDAYGRQDYDTARAVLKEALELCANAGLDQHPITARTHIHFGVVAIVGFKQREVGIKQFRKALEIQPDIKLTKSLVTPDLQDAFEEAVLAGNEGGPAGGAAPAGGQAEGEGGGQAGQQAEDNGGEGESKPPPRRSKPPPRHKRGDDDDDKDKDKDEEGGDHRGSFYMTAGIGTGFGYATGNGQLDPMHKLGGGGFALPQSLVISPEVGWFVTPELLLSGAFRIQYLFGLTGEVSSSPSCGSDGFCEPAPWAVGFLAKATYFMGTGSVRFALGGELGVGTIRNAVSFNAVTNCKGSASDPMTTGCVDTLKGGPFLIGPTFGLYFELASAVDLFVALNTEIGLPTFTFNLDPQIGLALRL
jgi:hypothetical protein